MTYSRVGGQLFNERGSRIELHLDIDRAERAQTSPDPIARLRDVVTVHRDFPAEELAVTTAATLSGVGYGLTHGDLRALLQRLGG